MPNYGGGPLQIERQAKLEAFRRDAHQELVEAFWPKRDEIKIFQPEPGCSEPTFVGSAADLDHHAASLLNIGLVRVASLQVSQASLDLLAAPWSGRKKRDRQLRHYKFATYQNQKEKKK